ncbi:acetolactate decarboxylase [Tundrisphaera sp. TA3]|uniref:acetolactate decarboxylase n=1 Tax=Tundrisphaera sp. TA3 TaxID=3435775 RepID=UPI003EBE9D72
MTIPRITPIALGLLAVVGCTPDAPMPARAPDRITQVSVINALMVGRYDGVMPMSEFLRLGDFGVGTLDHLDGELTVLDGLAFQVRGDGSVHPVGDDRSVPFASITPFDSDGEFPLSAVGSLEDLDARLGAALPQKNSFVAIRVDGRFSSITLRSVHRQEPPYRPLGEVAKTQSMWTREDLAGTLVGIRSPAWVGGINVPGYHWHFLSDDRKVGGHVLDCRAGAVRVRYDVCQEWMVKLDGTPGADQADLAQDTSKDLRRVESSRGDDRER